MLTYIHNRISPLSNRCPNLIILKQPSLHSWPSRLTFTMSLLTLILFLIVSFYIYLCNSRVYCFVGVANVSYCVCCSCCEGCAVVAAYVLEVSYLVLIVNSCIIIFISFNFIICIMKKLKELFVINFNFNRLHTFCDLEHFMSNFIFVIFLPWKYDIWLIYRTYCFNFIVITSKTLNNGLF